MRFTDFYVQPVCAPTRAALMSGHYSLPDDAGECAAVKRQAQLLEADGFDGYFSLEIINPDDPEATLAAQSQRWKALRDSMAA